MARAKKRSIKGKAKADLPVRSSKGVKGGDAFNTLAQTTLRDASDAEARASSYLSDYKSLLGQLRK